MKRFIKGFTLAEVLITLAIIGIVAAMTIPVLIQKYEKSVQVNRLKKFYSTFTQGINSLKLETGCENVECMGFVGTANDETWNNTMEENIKKVFRVTKVCKYGDDSCKQDSHYMNGNFQEEGFKNCFCFMTADGFKIKILPKPSGSEYNTITVDTNGNNAPNIIGRDIHLFRMTDNGVIHPYYGAYYGRNAVHIHWKTNPNLCGSIDGSVSAQTTTGFGCTARIMEEGWQMNF